VAAAQRLLFDRLATSIEWPASGRPPLDTARIFPSAMQGARTLHELLAVLRRSVIAAISRHAPFTGKRRLNRGSIPLSQPTVTSALRSSGNRERTVEIQGECRGFR
jgi:hypothetical protein